MHFPDQQKSKKEFVKSVTDGLTEPPQYFSINARINKEGYESLDEVLETGLTAIPVNEFKALLLKDTILLDTRTADVWHLALF